jgi:hypothetical protein
LIRFGFPYPAAVWQRPIVVGLVALLLISGCSSRNAKESTNRANSRLNWLLRVRNQAMSRGQVPKSEEEFKRYLNSLDAATQDRIKKGAGVSNVEELFISERDGEPYAIFYGQPPAGVAKDLIAYERTGVDGVRFVGYGLGAVAEADEQKFNELVPPAARPAK